MKRFLNWLVVSEWGLLITIVGVALIIITLMAFFPRPKPIVIDDSMITYIDHSQVWVDTTWCDDISNPANQPYVLEVAFNLDIPYDSVTQEQFNTRYLREQ